MKHILGMAKSSLDLKGAKGPKIELDYLRLVYAVKEIRKQGEDAQGYLVVFSPQIKARANQWEHKYKCENCVEVIDLTVPLDVNSRLKKEKEDNIAGMIAGSTKKKVVGRSNADIGRDTGETGLHRTILMLEPRTKQLKDENCFPFGIRWDFYGVVD